MYVVFDYFARKFVVGIDRGKLIYRSKEELAWRLTETEAKSFRSTLRKLFCDRVFVFRRVEDQKEGCL